jgi:hypothetical protein
MKGCACWMRKRVVLTVVITLLVLLIFSVPALAAVYQYTFTGFRYIGDIFHQREVEIDGGPDNFRFIIRGEGSVVGTHEVHASTSPADEVYGPKSFDKVNMSAYFVGTTALNAAVDKKLLLISEIDLYKKHRAVSRTGVEMDPGETGYIKQFVSSNIGNGGKDEHLSMMNIFGNSGGTTKRILEVDGFVSDTMRVDGYAEVYETTEISNGKAKSGWWDIQP